MKRSLLTLALLTPLAIGCDATDDADAGAGADPAAQTTAETTAQQTSQTQQSMAQLPDTTAAAVWSYLQEAGYAQDWRLWPGTSELYEGTEPHGMLLTTYLNQTAYDALRTGGGPLPNGSIVVKENYRPDSTLAAVTVMYSSEGYDAEYNDYFWAKYTPDGGVDAAGRVESCQSCHSAGERGFLRTAYDPASGATGQ